MVSGIIDLGNNSNIGSLSYGDYVLYQGLIPSLP